MQFQNAEIRAELRKSVNKAEGFAEERRAQEELSYAEYEELYGMSADVAVGTARDHIQNITRYPPFHCQHPFGCYQCCEQFPSGQVHCTKEDWAGCHPFHGCSYWSKITVTCPACFDREERERQEQREFARQARAQQERWIEAEQEEAKARQKYKRALQADREICRLDRMMAHSETMRTFALTLERLTVPGLKRLCKRNGLMNSGKKKQLVYRLTAARFHGTRYACPACGKKKLELQYKQAEDVNPVGIRCKHMKNWIHGKLCSFQEYFDDDNETKAEVLKDVLRDTKELDLYSVMTKKKMIRKSKK